MPITKESLALLESVLACLIETWARTGGNEAMAIPYILQSVQATMACPVFLDDVLMALVVLSHPLMTMVY